MTYLITDLIHHITVNLETTYQYKSNLKLNTYINDSTTIAHTYSATSTTDGVIFNIPFSDYQVNDEITKMTLTTTASTDIWDTREGVTILVNGENESVMEADNNAIILDSETNQPILVNPVHTEQFGINFKDFGDYTIQGIYVGNNLVDLSTTDEYNFQIKGEIDGGANDGSYALKFQKKNLTKMVWNDKTKINFVLTKNNQPLASKTVEMVTPISIRSEDTNSQGVTGYLNTGFKAGKYKLGAYYVVGGTIVAKTYKTITIEKAEAKITYTNGTVSKNGTINIWVKDAYGTAISNEKVSVYVNGKLKSKKTDSNGKISFKVYKAQTYKFKVVYKGNANIKAKTLTFSKTVSA